MLDDKKVEIFPLSNISHLDDSMFGHFNYVCKLFINLKRNRKKDIRNEKDFGFHYKRRVCSSANDIWHLPGLPSMQ